MVSRFDVYLINLDDRLSDDPKNTRPAVVVSPDEVNRNLNTVLIAPIASTNTRYPTRIGVSFLNAERHIILDQIRAVDKVRLVKKIGEIERSAQGAVISRLHELFAE